MKVFSLSNQPRIYFRLIEPIAYDDEISQQRRNFIRQHYDSWHNKYYTDIYEKEHRLDEYELNKMVDFYRSKSKKIDPKSFEIPIKRIDSCARTSVFRGETLRYAHPDVLEKLKKAGFETIIDLAGFGMPYREKVENAGLKFFSMPMESYWLDSFFNGSATQEHKRQVINNFVQFINTLQDGNAYIACEFGSYKTDDAVMLNSFFNAKANRHSRIVRCDYMIDKMKIIYDNLTQMDKEKLKWTPAYEQKFLNMLKSAREVPFRH